MTEDPRRFLVVAPDRIGDLVMAQSLFIALKNRDPACRIDVLARLRRFPLLERMPQVAKAIPLPEDFEGFGMAERLAFARQIHSFGYTHAIVLNEGWRFALLTVLARIPVRTGFASKALLNDPRVPDPRWTILEKFVSLGFERALASPFEPTLPNLEIGLHNQIPVIEKFSIAETDEPVLALCPGGISERRWEKASFSRLASGAMEKGWRVWLLGDEQDGSIGQEISENAESCRNFIGRADLAELIDLLSLADVVISNVSDWMHIALALHRQILILGDPERVDSPACRQAGARVLPLQMSAEQVLAELPGA